MLLSASHPRSSSGSGRGTDWFADSPLEERVYCELVSEKGDCGAWLIRPDSRGFLDDKTSVRALFLALISQGISFLVPRQLRDILVLSY